MIYCLSQIVGYIDCVIMQCIDHLSGIEKSFNVLGYQSLSNHAMYWVNVNTFILFIKLLFKTNQCTGDSLAAVLTKPKCK